MNELVRSSWWSALSKIHNQLFAIFFFFMPFTQALTFKVGFPLKVSELALISLSISYLFFAQRVALPKKIIYILSFLFFWVTASFLINLIWNYDHTLKSFPTRFGFKGDSLFRYIYFNLALLAFFVSVDAFIRNERYFLKIWIAGAICAAIYSWYLVIFSFLKLPILLLPGMENPPQMIMNGIIRSGTFLEGNMMGLYLLISAGMSFYLKRFQSGFFLLGSVFTSFSTLGIVSVGLFLFLYYKNFILRKKYIPYFLLVFILLIPIFNQFVQTTLYKQYIHEKIFGSTTTISNEANYSKVDRVTLGKIAYEMGKENPFFGVGLSNYGRHYDYYFFQLPLTPAVRKALARENAKPIPNNIYLELFSEVGIVGLIIFSILLLQLLFYTTWDQSKVLFPILICVYLCYNAYPSFIMIYLWVLMALPVSNYIKKSKMIHGN